MLGIADYGAFCATIVLFLALPGPGTLALLTSTSRGGFRGGAAATFGLIAGDQVLLWLAVAGVAALLAAHPLLFGALQYLGAAYLSWIGLRLLVAPARSRMETLPASPASPASPVLPASVASTASSASSASPTAFVTPAPPAPPVERLWTQHHFRQAFLITLLNPKAIVFYMAFFPLFIDPATPHRALTFAAMAGTVAMMTATYCLLLCAFADAIGTAVRAHHRLGRWLERAAGVLLLGFGVRLASQ